MKIDQLSLTHLGKRVRYEVNTIAGDHVVTGKLLAFEPNYNFHAASWVPGARKTVEYTHVDLHIGISVVHAEAGDNIHLLED